MQRTAILITTLLMCAASTACDSSKNDAASDKTAKADDGKKPAGKAKADKADSDNADADKTGADKAKVDPWEAKLASRVLADSGLDVGSRLSAFDIINCESGEQYCQVCKFGGNPKLMAVGTADDEAFKNDLKDLDAIAKKYASQNLKAFAVITDIVDGKATTPSDPKALQAKAEAIRKELGITMPIVVPAPGAEGSNKIWNEYYNITASRTVMFSDGRNNVEFSAVGPADWSGLAASIEKVVGKKTG